MIGDRLLRVAHHAFIVLLVVVSAIALSAQTVVDPQFVEFAPSPDHSTLATDGTPLVQRYSLTVYPVGSSVAFDTMDLGKPTPSAGIIRVDFLPLRHTVPTPGVTYEARVAAIGPGGSTASTVSNGFSFQAACTPTLNSTSQSVGSGASTGSVGVTAGTGCTWSAVSNAGWITLTGATGGTGNGSVPYSVAANATTSARSGTLTIAGQTYTVNQAAAACTVALNPASQPVAGAGGSGSTGVTAPTGCAWTTVNNAVSWLTITGGATGNGNGTVTYTAFANPTAVSRSGTLTIGGQTFTVNQAGASCTFTVTPTAQTVLATGGTGSAGVTALAGCAWTATSNNTTWLTITAGASGNGDGTVSFSAASNPNTSPRTGTLTIAGQTFSVNQAAASCSYTLSAMSQSVAAGGGTGSTNVTAQAGCAWTGVSNNTSWLTVTSGASGTGSGTVAFSAASNPNTSPRTGTITIGGQTFSVNQAAASCTYALVPASQSVLAAGGTGSTSVTTLAGCAWTAASNNTPWLTVTSGASGNGGGTVAFSVSANPNGTQRNGTLTIGGQTFSVTQAPAACTYTLLPTSQSVVAGGGTGSTAVTAPTGCAWTGVSNSTPWLTVTSGANGSGNGTVAFNAAANPNTSPRTGTITIGGQTFSVNQAAAACTFSVTPPSVAIASTSSGGSATVTAPTGCAWTGVSNSGGWLSVTSGSSGTGNGSVVFSATANGNATQRVGTLTVAGQTVTVTQAGVGCTFTISANSLSVTAAGGSGLTNVTSPSGCPWSATPNDSWITVTSGGSGSGNGSAGFSVAANPNASPRTGSLTIASQTFTVSQAAAACTFTLNPASQPMAGGGGSGSTSVTAPNGCAWTTVNNAASWLTITGGATGNGNGTVTYTAFANPTALPRSGTLTIGGQTFTVNQAGASCTFTLTPTAQTVLATGGTGSAGVTALAGCAWTAVSNNTTWLTITAGASGNGDGTVSFSAAANTLTQQRTGTLTIAGQTFTVNQGAAGCSFSISPTSQTVAAAGGNGSATVTTTTGCSWTAASNASWINITAGGSGSGAGSTAFTIAPSTSSAQRTGSLTIAGRQFTVTQSPNTCTYTLTPASHTLTGTGGSGTITVGTASGCAWAASTNQSWITVSGSGTASGSASYTVQPNTTGANRTGAISIGTQVFAVIQGTGGGTAPVSPTGLRIVVIGGLD